MATWTYAIGQFPWLDSDPLGPMYGLPADGCGVFDWRRYSEMSVPNVASNRAVFAFPTSVAVPSTYQRVATGDCREIQVTGQMRTALQQAFGTPLPGNTLAEVFLSIWLKGDPTGENEHFPIMPGRDNTLRVLMHGHGEIAARPFNWNDLHGKKVRDRLRREFVAAAKSGMPQTVLARVLGATCQKRFGRWNDPRFVELHTPNEFEAVPAEPQTSLAENFNAASGFGNVYAWTQYAAGYFVNASNKAKRAGGDATWGRNFARCDTPVSDDDHICGIFVDTLAGNPANEQFGAVGRNKSSELGQNNYLYRAVEAAPAYHDMDIVKTTSGTPSILSTITTLYDNIDIWLTCNGSSLLGQTGVAKTTRNSTTDSTHAGALFIYGGLYSYSSSGTATADNWTLEDLAAAVKPRIIGGGII